MISSEAQIATATNAELAEIIRAGDSSLYHKVMQEVNRRNTGAQLSKPFDPRVEVSADAKYIWIRVFVWFWVVPVVLGILAYIIVHS